jgi:hypothetical protein
VNINPDLRKDFEEKFASISVGAVIKNWGSFLNLFLKPQNGLQTSTQ